MFATHMLTFGISIRVEVEVGRKVSPLLLIYTDSKCAASCRALVYKAPGAARPLSSLFTTPPSSLSKSCTSICPFSLQARPWRMEPAPDHCCFSGLMSGVSPFSHSNPVLTRFFDAGRNARHSLQIMYSLSSAEWTPRRRKLQG
jgi:hypothetical protein